MNDSEGIRQAPRNGFTDVQDDPSFLNI